jgi:peptidoglycan/xylan/chitin deacetylase (PgdA/CDA1 family)
MFKKISIVLFFVLFSISGNSLFAKGPKRVATIDRSLWPLEMNSKADFNTASRLELLVFIQAFDAIQKEKRLFVFQSFLGFKKVNTQSITLWVKKIKGIVTENFSFASQNCKKIELFCFSQKMKWKELLTFARTFNQKLPQNFQSWYQSSKQFHQYYLYEQLRLSALFPRISSEILTLSQQEKQGWKLPDLSFLLTFDDGPTKSKGKTDRLIRVLRKHKKNGFFFVLGDRFAKRLRKNSKVKVQKLYQGMCLASHGKSHKAHDRWKKWQTSLDYTHDLIQKSGIKKKEQIYFRPPYGRRNTKIVNYLENHQSNVMLWNIDSQDWNRRIKAKSIANRMITLMLLWRRGILLFHDVHPKAEKVLPILFQQLESSKVQWLDCHSM